MDIEIIRRLDQFGGEGMCELLIRVDEEYMDMYRKETGENDFNQESFNQWMVQQMEQRVEDEGWKLEGEEWKCED
tara:strand:- start:265 stop:489 length:225 start_codon:yes stop_codon:yes gene_type:complete